MYDYNSKIRYEIKNNFISKKMSIATKRMKQLHKLQSIDNNQHKKNFKKCNNRIMICDNKQSLVESTLK